MLRPEGNFMVMQGETVAKCRGAYPKNGHNAAKECRNAGGRAGGPPQGFGKAWFIGGDAVVKLQNREASSQATSPTPREPPIPLRLKPDGLQGNVLDGV